MYKVRGEGFRLNDLFNVLDMHGQSGHGFRVKNKVFLTPQRILGARNALKMLQQTTLYIDWQCGREENREDLEHHYEFAKALGRRMQRQGLELAGSNISFDDRKFYMGDVSFACFNWEPIALWCQFVANRNMNKSLSVPHAGHPACKLQIFHDLGHFVAGPRVELKGDRSPETPWHPMNESSALQLNDADHGSNVRIRISKFLLPHGCLWWRECPNCGKLSSYMGDKWEWDSSTLIPPPPLKAFVQNVEFQRRRDDEGKAWDKGEVDARACVHCKTLTYAHHTQTIMQSNFKSPPPPFLDEIKRDLRVAVQRADHIVLMGYSLPPDDVDYRAFFAARRRLDSKNDSEISVKCSVVGGTKYGHQWYGPSEWTAMLPDMKQGEVPSHYSGSRRRPVRKRERPLLRWRRSQRVSRRRQGDGLCRGEAADLGERVMAKMIKFDLPIDGVKVTTLDDLQDHFTTEIIGHFRSSLLARWLRSRGWTRELAAVEALTTDDDATTLKELCRIFEIEADDDAIAAAVAEATGVPGVRPNWNPGDTFQDCPGCPKMVVVPSGSFMMGSPEEEDRVFAHIFTHEDKYPHEVRIGYQLAVGVYPVIFDEWDACVSDGGCGGHEPEDQGWGRGTRPVINVNWDDAKRYVGWLSWKTGKGYRLLSESEWEYVTRAGTDTSYWWGNEIGRNRANCDGCGSRWDDEKTSPVGSFSAECIRSV